jgi:hypothetical protein
MECWTELEYEVSRSCLRCEVDGGTGIELRGARTGFAASVTGYHHHCTPSYAWPLTPL